MGKRIGYLKYNFELNRMGVLDSMKMNLWAISGLSSGECFEVLINNNWIADRIEYISESKEWYLVYSGLAGRELEELTVRF